jgi:hypothetical protein
MSGSPHINVPHVDTQTSDFDPILKLPPHLQEYKKIADETRHKMTPVMQAVLELMDNVVLRTAALPQPE